jgi:hypothetical protein
MTSRRVGGPPVHTAGEPTIRQRRLVHRTMPDPPRTRRSTMRDARTLSVGLEGHQASIAVA